MQLRSFTTVSFFRTPFFLMYPSDLLSQRCPLELLGARIRAHGEATALASHRRACSRAAHGRSAHASL